MATTWASTGVHSVKATCTTGSESAPAAPVQASQTVAFASAVAGNTVTVRGMVFTAIAADATPATSQEFSVGASNTACGDNFAAAVNKNKAILGVTAANASGTVTITASDYGVAGNAITLSRVGAPITVSGATLSGGVDLVGMPLDGVSAWMVLGEADATQTLTNGVIGAFIWNPYSLLWSRASGLDVAVGASAIRSVAGAGSSAVAGKGVRVAYVPVGVTVSAGNVTVYHNAYDSNGALI